MKAMSPTIQKIVKAPFGENNNKYFIIFAPMKSFFRIVLSYLSAIVLVPIVIIAKLFRK